MFKDNYCCICRKAIEEIIRDTKRGAIRAEVGGAYGWKSVPRINPRLFGNTLIQVIQTNKRKDKGSIVKNKHNKVASYKTKCLSRRQTSSFEELNIESKDEDSKTPNKIPIKNYHLLDRKSGRPLKRKDGK